MNLTVTKTQTGNASVKTIKIQGYSTRLDPNNTEEITVALRKLTYENDEEVAITDPPVLSSFDIVPSGSTTPIEDGKAVWGTVNISISGMSGSPEATLSTFRVYADSEVVGEIMSPNNNGSYPIAWDTTELDDLNRPLYLDGTKRLVFEAVDNLGGLTRIERYVRLDNTPVTNTFPNQVIATTVGAKITAVWGTIPDPDGAATGATRYYVVLRQTTKEGVVTDYPQTINPPDVSTVAPTTATFAVTYSNQNTYEIYVYPVCPEDCGHSTPYSTKYLYKKF